MSNYFYLDVQLKFESEENQSIDVYKLKQIITNGVKGLFGEAGIANQVDILKYSQQEGRAILRCFADFYVKLRASLSFCSDFDNLPGTFHVIKASPCLLSLLANSTTYQF